MTWRSTSRDSSTPSRRAADGVLVSVSAIGIRSTRGIARGGRYRISRCHLPGTALRSGSRAADLGDPCSTMARDGAGPAGRAPLGRAVPVELVHRVPEQPARFLRARAGPALLDENRLQGKIGQRTENALQRCFMRERRAFLIPVCPPLWKMQKDDGCTYSGSALVREDQCAGPLRPRVDGLGGGEQALHGHRGLHVEEKAAAAGVGFRGAPRRRLDASVHRRRWFRDRHPVARGGGSRRPGLRPTPGACRCGRAPSRRPQCSTGWQARARRRATGDWSMQLGARSAGPGRRG